MPMVMRVESSLGCAAEGAQRPQADRRQTFPELLAGQGDEHGQGKEGHPKIVGFAEVDGDFRHRPGQEEQRRKADERTLTGKQELRTVRNGMGRSSHGNESSCGQSLTTAGRRTYKTSVYVGELAPLIAVHLAKNLPDIIQGVAVAASHLTCMAADAFGHIETECFLSHVLIPLSLCFREDDPLVPLCVGQQTLILVLGNSGVDRVVAGMALTCGQPAGQRIRRACDVHPW